MVFVAARANTRIPSAGCPHSSPTMIRIVSAARKNKSSKCKLGTIGTMTPVVLNIQLAGRLPVALVQTTDYIFTRRHKYYVMMCSVQVGILNKLNTIHHALSTLYFLSF